MTSDLPCHIDFITLIAGRKQKEELLKTVSEVGGCQINFIYGKGSSKSGYLRDMFGLVPEENKVVILFLLSRDKTDYLFELLNSKFHFDKPNTGIAYSVPVDNLFY